MLYTIAQAALLSGVCTKTIRRWEARGLVTPARSPGGYRRYTPDHVRLLKRLTAAGPEGRRRLEND